MVGDNHCDRLISRIRELASHEDAGGALARVCALLRDEVTHYDWVGFYLAVPGERLLVLGPFEGAPTEHLRIPFGTGVCGQAAELAETVVVPDVSEEGNYLACSLETRAEIVVPLFHEGVICGELDIDSHRRDPFDASDRAMLSRIAEIVSPLAGALAGSLGRFDNDGT